MAKHIVKETVAGTVYYRPFVYGIFDIICWGDRCDEETAWEITIDCSIEDVVNAVDAIPRPTVGYSYTVITK